MEILENYSRFFQNKATIFLNSCLKQTQRIAEKYD